jgi:hypothetical protein
MADDELSAVFREYPLPPPASLNRLRRPDGLSGARLWRAQIGPERFCLRQWPQGINLRRIAAIGRVLRHVVDIWAVGGGAASGAAGQRAIVAAPVTTRQGEFAVVCTTGCYTLEPWLPGEPWVPAAAAFNADPQTVRSPPPIPARKLQTALATLARFHLAAESYPGDPEFASAHRGSAPGLAQRLVRLRTLLDARFAPLDTAPAPKNHPILAEIGPQIIDLVARTAPRVLASQDQAARRTVPLQICIRDVWSAHVLFTGDEVTGLVDFDALRVDSVATDLARLLGSYCSDDAAAWQTGIEAYHAVRPLSGEERELIAAYDQTAVLLTGIQWLEWLLLENRQFEPGIVGQRVLATLARLRHLSAASGSG